MNIVGIIPARGASKGIKDKNIIDLNGKPLISYTIEAALGSGVLDRIIVSTDSDKIADVVRARHTIEIVMRPAEFAKDDSPIEEALLHVVEHLKKTEGYATDIVVWMQPNVPIRPKGIIGEVVKKLISSGADSCVTCYKASQIPEAMKIINEKGRLVPLFEDVSGIRRQEFPDRYLCDGSVVAILAKNLFRTRGVRKSHVYMGKEIVPVIQQDRMYSLEIDELADIPLAEYYMRSIAAKP